MLDMLSLHIMAALVVVVSGAMYLLETILRKDGAAGRLWAVAFLAGILTVVSYFVWAVDPTAFVAIALGNGGFVASAAFVWLGALAFNGRRLRVASLLAAGGVLAAMIAVLIEGPDGGDWAGGSTMFVAIAVFAGAAAVETRRGAMGRRWSAIGLTIVLAVEAAFFAARLVVLVTVGTDSEVFRVWLGSPSASFLTVALTIVTAIVTSVLRASESNLRGQRDTYALHVGLDGVMLPASFQSAVTTMLERADRAHETLCLVAIRVDDLSRIATAFGPGEAEALAATWRTGVRRYAPTASMVGEHGATSILVAFLTTSFADVRRTASIMHRRLLDDFSALGLSVVPVVGVGIALTDQIGHDFVALSAAAEDAARRSATSPDASVILAEN
jgi:GGDEF domain-containing protein